VRKQLDEAGLQPALDRNQVGARFYMREEVRKALASRRERKSGQRASDKRF
jgi:hypothetical protein